MSFFETVRVTDPLTHKPAVVMRNGAHYPAKLWDLQPQPTPAPYSSLPPNALSFSAREEELAQQFSGPTAPATEAEAASTSAEARRELFVGLRELYSRTHVYETMRSSVADRARRFEEEAVEQVALIEGLRKELKTQEANYARKRAEVQHGVDELAGLTRAINDRRTRLLYVATRLGAVGSDFDRSSLASFGLRAKFGTQSTLQWLTRESAASENCRTWKAGVRAGVEPEALLYDVYRAGARIDWPPGVEANGRGVLFDANRSAVFGDGVHFKLVQVVTRDAISNAHFDDSFDAKVPEAERFLVIYRFLVVDPHTFGRTAVLVDGVLLRGEEPQTFVLRYWPSTLASTYLFSPSAHVKEARLTGVAVPGFDTHQSIDGFMKARPAMARAVGKHAQELHGREFSLAVDWSSADTTLSLPLEAMHGTGNTHSGQCRVECLVVAVRVATARDGKAPRAEVLIRTLDTNQLGWMKLTPARKRAMLENSSTKQITGAPGTTTHTCACEHSFANTVRALDRRDLSECAEHTVAHSAEAQARKEWRELDRVALGDREQLLHNIAQPVAFAAPVVGVSSERELQTLPRAQASPSDEAIVEREKKRARRETSGELSEAEKFLTQYKIEALDADGNPVTKAAEGANMRSCAICKVPGTNRKGHDEPNHKQRDVMSQEHLLMWMESIKADKPGRVDELFRVSKRV